jgi:transcription antitermination factor NusG
VFYTRPRNEKKVAERLSARGIDVCLPLRTVLRQWSDRKKKVQEPLFPGYLFAHVDERERMTVLQDDGVVTTVSFGGTLAEARQDEIDTLRALESVPKSVEARALDAVPAGAEVIVTNGPLKGARGTVDGSPKAFYLSIAVDSIRQALRLEVPADWVMRTDAGSGRT